MTILKFILLLIFGIPLLFYIWFASLIIYALFRNYLEKTKDEIRTVLMKISIVSLILITIFFGSRIRDGFTDVNVLTERIYESSVYEYNGSKCRDGTNSHSQGRGTCSWHKGVLFTFYKGQHKKNKSQCKLEARKRSWIWKP